MKYRVTLSPKKFSDDDKIIKLVAVSADNAKELAEMRHPNFSATKAVRLATAPNITPPSTLNVLNGLKDEFIEAKHVDEIETAKCHEKAFYGTIAALQSVMNDSEYRITKSSLPVLPPVGKK